MASGASGEAEHAALAQLRDVHTDVGIGVFGARDGRCESSRFLDDGLVHQRHYRIRYFAEVDLPLIGNGNRLKERIFLGSQLERPAVHR